jgi:hypothetical protein
VDLQLSVRPEATSRGESDRHPVRAFLLQGSPGCRAWPSAMAGVASCSRRRSTAIGPRPRGGDIRAHIDGAQLFMPGGLAGRLPNRHADSRPLSRRRARGGGDCARCRRAGRGKDFLDQGARLSTNRQPPTAIRQPPTANRHPPTAIRPCRTGQR